MSKCPMTTMRQHLSKIYPVAMARAIFRSVDNSTRKSDAINYFVIHEIQAALKRVWSKSKSSNLLQTPLNMNGRSIEFYPLEKVMTVQEKYIYEYTDIVDVFVTDRL